MASFNEEYNANCLHYLNTRINAGLKNIHHSTGLPHCQILIILQQLESPSFKKLIQLNATSIQAFLLHEIEPFFIFKSSSNGLNIVELSVPHGSVSFENTCNLGTTCLNRLRRTLHLWSGLSDPRTSGKNRHSSKSQHHHRKHFDGTCGYRTKQALIMA